MCEKRLALDHLAQDVLQDAAVAEVVSLTRGVNADVSVKLDGFAGLLGGGDVDGLRDGAFIEGGDALNIEGFSAIQPQGLVGLALWELQWDNAHADQVGTVDALEGLSDYSLYAKQVGALCSPVTGGTSAVLLTSDDYQRNAGFLIVCLLYTSPSPRD